MPMENTYRAVYDGPIKSVVQFTAVSDGTGDEHLVPKVNVADLENTPKYLKIYEIEYDVVGGLVRLFWESDTPTEFATLSGFGEFDYAENKVVMPDTKVPGFTGNILCTTMGFDAGSSYMIKLSLKKSFKAA